MRIKPLPFLLSLWFYPAQWGRDQGGVHPPPGERTGGLGEECEVTSGCLWANQAVEEEPLIPAGLEGGLGCQLRALRPRCLLPGVVVQPRPGFPLCLWCPSGAPHTAVCCQPTSVGTACWVPRSCSSCCPGPALCRMGCWVCSVGRFALGSGILHQLDHVSLSDLMGMPGIAPSFCLQSSTYSKVPSSH